MPYPNFKKSFECLDTKRLGKQRLETFQLIKVVKGESTAWQNHPAAKMWRGYVNCLIEYFNLNVAHWVERGYKNSYAYLEFVESETFNDPYWLGDEKFHASHRSNLLRKAPEHYKQFGWNEPNDLPYVWPEPSHGS